MSRVIKEAINPFSGLGKTKQILGNIGDNISTIFRFLLRPDKKTAEEVPIERYELTIRYRNARITAMILLTMFAWAFVGIFFAQTAQSFVLSFVCSLGVGLYYIALCKVLYKSRISLSNWSERGTISVTWSSYLNAIAEDPKNIFPRNIKQ